jgi:hypothetical protein
MTHFPQPDVDRRATRIHVASPAMVTVEDGHRAKAKLQTVSITGGLLSLAKALGQGDFVEVAFQTQSGPVQGMAEMLGPMRSARGGILQPFRFIALGDDDHRTLRMVVDSVSDRSFMGIRSNQS